MHATSGSSARQSGAEQQIGSAGQKRGWATTVNRDCDLTHFYHAAGHISVTAITNIMSNINTSLDSAQMEWDASPRPALSSAATPFPGAERGFWGWGDYTAVQPVAPSQHHEVVSRGMKRKRVEPANFSSKRS